MVLIYPYSIYKNIRAGKLINRSENSTSEGNKNNSRLTNGLVDGILEGSQDR